MSRETEKYGFKTRQSVEVVETNFRAVDARGNVVSEDHILERVVNDVRHAGMQNEVTYHKKTKLLTTSNWEQLKKKDVRQVD